MAESTPAKAPIVVPLILGALGALALARGLWRSSRAVVTNGKVTRCAGPSSFGGCDGTDVITTGKGEPVYAMAGGTIIAKGDDFVHLLSSYEPVILAYTGLAPSVKEGDTVWIGQSLGLSGGEVAFSASQIDGQNLVRLVPGAWLSSRGLQHVAGNTTSDYCNSGRTMTVPAQVKSCGFKLPQKPGFTLLPVSVDMP
jgi:hypothetical protein